MSKIFEPIQQNFTAPKQFMPCPPKYNSQNVYLAGPNCLCQTKYLFTYCDGPKLNVPEQKVISSGFPFCKFGFCESTEFFEAAINAIQFLV